MAQIMAFLLACLYTTDGEFLRHKTWRVRLTNWGMAEKKKEHNQILVAELNFIRLDGAVPRSECLRWRLGQSGCRLHRAEDGGPCVEGYRWGRGGSALCFHEREYDCVSVDVC